MTTTTTKVTLQYPGMVCKKLYLPYALILVLSNLIEFNCMIL